MPTLSLCMIVKNEEEVIARCLKSVEQLIDEIVIVDTGSKDNTIDICKQFTSSIYHFDWCNDFSKARNYSFQQATSDYILWLDADDVITPNQLDSLIELKTTLDKDVYFLKYDYSHDEYGESTCSFFRERIVKNDGSFQWIYPIHEVINGTAGRTSSYREITVKHQRTDSGHSNDYSRNLDILSTAILQPDYQNSARMWYYYGRELFDHQHYQKATEAFDKYLSLPGGWIEDQHGAYTKKAISYLELSRLQETKTSDFISKAREAARKAIDLDSNWAEPYFVMGEIAFDQQQFDEAIFWFKKCVRPFPEVLSPINRGNYGIDSFVKLMFCFDRLKNYEQANYYNNQALSCKPKDVGLLHNKDYFQSLLYPSKPKKNDYKIGWYGKGINPNFPTYRIRVLQMNQALNELGFSSEMIASETRFKQFDTIIFFKAINESEFRAMEFAKSLGTHIVFDIAEDLFEHTMDFPYYLPLIGNAHLVTCCSYPLADKIRHYNPNVQVIEDAIESVSHISEVRNTKAITFGWIGMPENVKHAEKLRSLIESLGCKLRTIHSGPNHDKLWTLEDWQKNLSECDAAIAPLDIDTQPCKSNNKVTTYQSLGLPLIAAPMDAYLRVVKNGDNGLIATTEKDWQTAITKLKNTNYREELRKMALNTVLAFKPKQVALKLMQAISKEQYEQSCVDIIIPTIYPTEHLQLCVDSIIACTTVPYRIIVIHNGEHKLDFLPSEVIILKGVKLNYSASINLGIDFGNAPYICMMNDDVIVSEGWLQPLINGVNNGMDFCNPLSNCDAGSLHNYELELESVQLGAGINTLCNGRITENNNNTSLHPSTIYTYKPNCERRKYLLEWVPFYCTLMSRQTVEKVGFLDEIFNNGCEDVDLCIRGKKLGLNSGVNEDSFVFHFGGTSTNKFIKENPEQEGETHRVYREKYSGPLLVIHAGHSYEAWNGNTLNSHGIGGSETAVIKMAESFSKQHYRVIVFCECSGLEGHINNVEYKHLNRFQYFIDRHFIDVFILSRYANFLEHNTRAARRFFWMHDIWAMGTETGENDLLHKHTNELDGIFCLSPWHVNFVRTTHQIPKDKLISTGNGIELSRFTKPPNTIPNRFIYSSSPDRSLDVLLRIFSKIKKVLPDATLHIYYGFDNWNKSIDQSNNKSQKELRDKIYELMNQDGVTFHGRVNQAKLAEAFLKSDIWLYPTQFTETYCITALEAQISETICICSDLAGLSSTVSDRGILIKHDPSDPSYDEHVLQLVLDIQSDLERKKELLRKGKEWAQDQSWDNISTQWLKHFN